MVFEEKFYSIFQKHVPQNVVHYCYDLWANYKFTLKIKPGRATKFGDYRYSFENKSHTITINNDLNPYAFLVTYIHEVAHLVTYLNHGFKASPHGKEWKQNFKELLLPICNDLVFPQEVLGPLLKYIRNPKASSCSDHSLFTALRAFDERSEDLVYLSEIKPGEKFIFNERVFEKESIRRTRALCKESNSGKKYLIAKIALVKPMGAEVERLRSTA